MENPTNVETPVTCISSLNVVNPINVDTPATNTSSLNVENPTNVDNPLTNKSVADAIPRVEIPELNCFQIVYS